MTAIPANADPFGLDDAARRSTDLINERLLADPEGVMYGWIAVRLSDGGSDGVVYATRADAIRNQLHETQCAYVQVPPTGVTTAGMAAYLRVNRALYDAGMRIIDPDREVIHTRRRGGTQ